jgi:hypothetical protein
MNRGRTWEVADRTGGPLDELLDQLRLRIPGLIVKRLQVTYRGDDDNVYFIGDEHGPGRIQLDTAPDGQPPFLIEDGGRHETTDIAESIGIITSYLEQSRRGGQVVVVAATVGERVRTSESPWWHPSKDDLDWDEPLPGVIVLCPEYGAELPLWGEGWGNIDWALTKFSPELLDRLAAWQQVFDENYDYETGWRSDAAQDRWAHDANDLAADLRVALGTRAELVVNLWPLGE